MNPGMWLLLAAITGLVVALGRDGRRREVDEWVRLAHHDRKAQR